MVMDLLYNLLSRLKTAPVARDERGVTAVEYALIAVLFGFVFIGAIANFGMSLTAMIARVDIALASAPGK